MNPRPNYNLENGEKIPDSIESTAKSRYELLPPIQDSTVEGAKELIEEVDYKDVLKNEKFLSADELILILYSGVEVGEVGKEEVREVIKNSINTLFETGTSDDLADAAFLIEAYNYYSYPDDHLSLKDFE